jgi:predicted phage terminase large subunit-like protein
VKKTPQPTLQQVRAALSKRDFREFIKDAWPILEPVTPYNEGYHHAAIAEHLQAVSKGDIKKLIINAPPQMGKSILTSVLWPLWDWIEQPHQRFLCTSFKNDLAEELSKKSRRVFGSEWYQNNWGRALLDRNRKLITDTITVFENIKTGYRRMSTYETSTGFGGSRIIVDDPHATNVSDEMRVKDLRLFDTGLSNRGGANGAYVILMQRVHEFDLTGHLLSQGGYEHLCLPNEYDSSRSKTTSIGWKDPRHADGELLWPEVFTEAKTQAAKISHGTFNYQGQFNQSPVSRSGGLLDPSWFKEWSESKLYDTWDDMLTSWDFTFKGTKDSDFVVGQVWARKKQEYFLLDQVRQQADFVQTLAMFTRLLAKWPQVRQHVVEAKANGEAIISSLRQSVAGIIPVSPKDSKEARVSAVSPIIESGNIYIPADAKWKEDFLHEAALFPKGKNDDMVDSMSQAILRFEKTRKHQMRFVTHEIV